MIKRVAMVAVSLVAASLVWTKAAKADVIFSDNFGSYSGTAASSQAITGLPVEAFGTLSNWSGSGPNAIHAVQISLNSWAIMLFAGNAITTKNAIVANQVGQQYNVTFQYAPAAYASSAQATTSNDYFNVSTFDSSSNLLAALKVTPGPFPNTSANIFTAGGFSYIGDGVGGVTFIVSDPNLDGNFGGSITGFSVASAVSDTTGTAIPEPSSVMLVVGGLALALGGRYALGSVKEGKGNLPARA